MARLTIDVLTSVLRQEIKEYAGNVDTRFGDAKFFFTENLDDRVFCITVPHIASDLPAELLMMAHISNDKIIIDLDTTDKPLIDALRQAGIPREQIVLAWQQS